MEIARSAEFPLFAEIGEIERTSLTEDSDWKHLSTLLPFRPLFRLLRWAGGDKHPQHSLWCVLYHEGHVRAQGCVHTWRRKPVNSKGCLYFQAQKIELYLRIYLIYSHL